ncbi:hypothetical protein L1987_64147 [Smallanthus sonchifolius]|uniref:Uncharacterized protein n=1 Tax=Smallanthus sonchifolius TaxID=185202 RepID=A0ACB9CFI9_9ASTR|nr:hypothetical protein L1987_64147 [Smallanthus sonchifolius]
MTGRRSSEEVNARVFQTDSNTMLWESFAPLGSLCDAYVARKKDKGGNLFGFIRMSELSDIHDLLIRMNLVTINWARVGVNIARFDKEGFPQRLPQSIPIASTGPSFGSHGNPLPPDPAIHGGNGTFKDVLLGNHSSKDIIPEISLKFHETAAMKFWNDVSLLGVATSLSALIELKQSLEGIVDLQVALR